MSSKLNVKIIKKRLTPYVLMLPTMCLVIGVLGYAVLSGIKMSFFQVDVTSSVSPFIGFGNYIDIFSDKNFTNAILTSLIFVIGSVSIGTVFSMAFALSLYKATKFKDVFKGLTLIPYLVSGIAAAIMWRFLFSGKGGLINMVIESISGNRGPNWLADSSLALIVVILANTWFVTPFSILVLLSGLQGLDNQTLEAAKVDGASSVKVFTKIVVPMIAPMIGISLIWLSFASFNMFDIILPLTGGGPGRSTEVLAVYMYNTAFRSLNYGKGSAVMVVLMIMNLTVSAAYLKLFRSSE